MKQPCKCGSWAINPHLDGRDPELDLDLCDVCYWKKRAEKPDLEESIIKEWKSITNVTRPINEIPEYFKRIFEAGWRL